MAADLPLFERQAETAYRLYLDHLQVCRRCGLSRTGRRCAEGLYLNGDVRATRAAVRLYERGRAS